jgi:arylsulfatase A
MKKNLLITVLSVFAAVFFAAYSHAAMENCDFSSPKNGSVDGSDLAEFAAYYAALNPNADVNGDGPVNEADVAHFAGFFGGTFPIRPPNILLIIGDDIGLDVTTDMYPGLIGQLEAIYGSGSGVNGTPASTPALDRLAAQGMRFANAWAQPFCSPTRASYMTGLFAAKTNVKNYQEALDYRHTTFVQLLKAAGYSTAAFGKWHLAGFPVTPNQGMMPKKAGFELYKGGLGAAPSSYWNSYEYVVQDETTSDTGTYQGNLQPRTLPGIGSTTYSPVVQAADTIDWINLKAQNPDNPWFAYLAFNLSHATSGSPMMVVPDKDTLDCHPTDPLQDGPACKEVKQCGGTFGSTAIGSCNGRQLMRAMTTSMDTAIGKVLDAVDSIPSDTYVIYISDNGTPMYSSDPNSLGYQIDNMYITRTGRGKGTAYESGARVPLVVKGPGIAAGSQSGEFIHAADLFATVLTLAGLTPPVEVPNIGSPGTMTVDAVSLAPIIYGSASAARDPDTGYTLTESENLMSYPRNIVVGARNRTYKVIAKRNTTAPYNEAYEFYNLVDDPLEEDKLEGPDYIPADCSAYWDDPDPDKVDPRWNYCRLRKVIDEKSIF